MVVIEACALVPASGARDMRSFWLDRSLRSALEASTFNAPAIVATVALSTFIREGVATRSVSAPGSASALASSSVTGPEMLGAGTSVLNAGAAVVFEVISSTLLSKCRTEGDWAGVGRECDLVRPQNGL